MNKKTIITILLALAAMAGQAKTFKTIKNPVAMAHNIYGGELKAREVIFRDTATTVHFTIDYPKGQWFSINSTSFLMDENGNRYPLRSAEGITLNKYGESMGPTDFVLHFEPMPKRVQVFDYREGDGTGAFKLLGIHDKKYKIKFPTMQELADANPWTVPADWFKTDTVTIQGRIEDFNAEQFGFDMLHCYYKDEFEKEDAVQVLNIAPDGTFCKKFNSTKYHSSPVRARPLTSPSRKTIKVGTFASITAEAATTWSGGCALAMITAMYSDRFLLLKVSWRKLTAKPKASGRMQCIAYRR